METAVDESKDAEAQAEPETCTGFSKAREVPNAILQEVRRNSVKVTIEKRELPPSNVGMEDLDVRRQSIHLVQSSLGPFIVDGSVEKSGST